MNSSLTCSKYQVTSVLDIPCGDFRWMQSVDLGDRRYTGADIVSDLIRSNQRQHGSDNTQFVELDLITGPLPVVDLVLCRDCLVHFSFQDIERALASLLASGSTYLLTTTFTERRTPDQPRHRHRPLATAQLERGTVHPVRH